MFPSWVGCGSAECHNCKLPISPMYPLIELITGLLFVACYLSFGLTPETFKWLSFSCIIVILTITDLRVRILPDAINGPGFIAGLIFAWFPSRATARHSPQRAPLPQRASRICPRCARCSSRRSLRKFAALGLRRVV